MSTLERMPPGRNQGYLLGRPKDPWTDVPEARGAHIRERRAARDAAWRAMQRPETSRFAPLICALPSGAYFGLIPIERVVAFLAR